jgi:hypothetical protein
MMATAPGRWEDDASDKRQVTQAMTSAPRRRHRDNRNNASNEMAMMSVATTAMTPAP